MLRYVSGNDQSKGSSELKILLTDAGFHFDMLPFKPIWDLPTPSAFSGSSITMGQCGGQFGELTDNQKLDLDYFIQNYTT
jgi:hypothetical protein